MKALTSRSRKSHSTGCSVALQPRKSNNRKLRGLCPQTSPHWALFGGSEGPRTKKQLPRRRVSGLRRSAEQTPLPTLSASHNAWRSVSTQWPRAASLRPTRDWSPLMHGCRRQGSQNAVTRRWPMASPALSSATLRRCRRGPGFRARFVLVADINAHLQIPSSCRFSAR